MVKFLRNFSALFKYIHAFKNGAVVFALAALQKFPINVVLKNYKINYKANTRAELFLLSNGIKNIKYDVNDKTITLLDYNVKFLAMNIGDVYGVFFKEDYRDLQVKDMTVIDIGSGIGDSAVYFMKNGAKRVIAVEAYPENCYIAETNIYLNSLSDTVTIINADLSSINEKVSIRNEKTPRPTSRTFKTNRGKQIRCTTLEVIVNTSNDNNLLLKMDCEGCEYDIILNSSCELLRKFRAISLEFHNGSKTIIDYLNDCGFSTSIKNGSQEDYGKNNRLSSRIGILEAVRCDENCS